MFDKRVASARQALLKKDLSISRESQLSLEKSFFQSLRLPNNTHKTTDADRLTDVDAMLVDYFAEAAAVRLLDVGISSGVTTLELLDHFDKRGIAASGVGVDICIRGILWSRLGIDLLFDSAGNPLQIATPFFARGRPHYSQKSLQSDVLRLVLKFLDLSLVRKWVLRSRHCRSLPLVSPRLLERSQFSIVEHDVSQPAPEWDGSFDLVRAANILNLDYFSEAQIAAMLKNLTSWLKPGGLLLICRTLDNDGSNHGSLYRNVGDCLEHVRLIGNGSEVDPLVEDLFSVKALV